MTRFVPRRSTPFLTLAVVLAAGMLLVGCRTEGDQNATEGRAPTGADAVVEVNLDESQMKLLDQVRGATIAFDISNLGGRTRSFVVTGPDGSIELQGSVRAADSERMIVELDPGTYTVTSEAPGEDRFEQTLTVAAPSASATQTSAP